MQHSSRGLREDTLLDFSPKVDNITLGQAGISTHKRLLQLFFKINDADTVVHSFKSAFVIWLSISMSRSSGANTSESCNRNSGRANNAKGVPRQFSMSENSAARYHSLYIRYSTHKYIQIFYTYRHTLWTNIFRHVNSSSATDAQRWCSRLKSLGTFPFRDYKYLGKKQTAIVHLLEERHVAWEILDSLGCYETVQVYGITMLTIIFASWFWDIN